MKLISQTERNPTEDGIYWGKIMEFKQILIWKNPYWLMLFRDVPIPVDPGLLPEVRWWDETAPVSLEEAKAVILAKELADHELLKKDLLRIKTDLTNYFSTHTVAYGYITDFQLLKEPGVSKDVSILPIKPNLQGTLIWNDLQEKEIRAIGAKYGRSIGFHTICYSK